jgi:rfaE bifunctional protein nucleotidyltransferase chain/domain
VSSLSFAKAQGDILVVAVNGDASVRRLKGQTRPILPLAMRLELLAALKPVDFVVAFHEDTAIEVVRTVKPDVYVKGADYQLDTTPEGIEVLRYGGCVVAAPLIPDISTSGIIAKIRLQRKEENA